MAGNPQWILYRDDVYIGDFDWGITLTEEHLPTLAESGKVFLGWYTSDGYKYAVGDTVAEDGEGVSATTGALYLYSKWEERDLTDWEPVYTVTRETLLALGDAIRAKTGGTGYMTPAEMIAAIEGLVVVKLITFTIDNTGYTAKEGMTWSEWVESEYNTDGYVISGSAVNLDKESLYYEDWSYVDSSDAILANYKYICSTPI